MSGFFAKFLKLTKKMNNIKFIGMMRSKINKPN